MADSDATIAAFTTATEPDPVLKPTMSSETEEILKGAGAMTSNPSYPPGSEGDILDHCSPASSDPEIVITDKPELVKNVSSAETGKDSAKQGSTPSVPALNTISNLTLASTLQASRSEMIFSEALSEPSERSSTPDVAPASAVDDDPAPASPLPAGSTGLAASASPTKLPGMSQFASVLNLTSDGSNGSLDDRTDGTDKPSKMTLSEATASSKSASTTQRTSDSTNYFTNTGSTNDLFYSTRGSDERTDDDGTHEAARKPYSNDMVSRVLQKMLVSEHFGEDALLAVKAVSDELLKEKPVPTEDAVDLDPSNPVGKNKVVEALLAAKSALNMKGYASNTSLSESTLQKERSLTAMPSKTVLTTRPALSAILDDAEPGVVESQAEKLSNSRSSTKMGVSAEPPSAALVPPLPVLVESPSLEVTDPTLNEAEKRITPEVPNAKDVIKPVQSLWSELKLNSKLSELETPTKVEPKAVVTKVVPKTVSRLSLPASPGQSGSKCSLAGSLTHSGSKPSLSESPIEVSSKLSLLNPRSKPSLSSTPTRLASKPSMTGSPTQAPSKLCLTATPQHVGLRTSHIEAPPEVKTKANVKSTTLLQAPAPAEPAKAAPEEVLQKKQHQVLDVMLDKAPKKELIELSTFSETPMQVQQEPPAASVIGVANEVLTEAPPKPLKEASKEPLQEASKEPLKEASKETPVEAPQEKPVETRKETPVAETRKETPVAETRKETPIAETRKKTPVVETRKETPVAERLKEILAEATRETLTEGPKKASVEVPKETLPVVSKETAENALNEIVLAATSNVPNDVLKEVLKALPKREPLKRTVKELPKETPAEAPKTEMKRRDRSRDRESLKGVFKPVKKPVGKSIPRLVSNAAAPPEATASTNKAATASASATSGISTKTERSYKQLKSPRPLSAKSARAVLPQGDTAGTTGPLSGPQRVAAARAAAAGPKQRKVSGGTSSLGTSSLAISTGGPPEGNHTPPHRQSMVSVMTAASAAQSVTTTSSVPASNMPPAHGVHGINRQRGLSTASAVGAVVPGQPTRRQSLAVADGAHRGPVHGHGAGSHLAHSIGPPGGHPNAHPNVHPSVHAPHGVQRSKTLTEIGSLEASYSSVIKSFIEAKKEAQIKTKLACEMFAEIEKLRHVASTKFGKDLPLSEDISGLADPTAPLIRPIRGSGEDGSFSEDSDRALTAVESALKSVCAQRSALLEDTVKHHANLLEWCSEVSGDETVEHSPKLVSEKQFADELVARADEAQAAEELKVGEVLRVLRTSMVDLDATKESVRELRSQLDLLNQENTKVTSSLKDCTKELEDTRTEFGKVTARKVAVEKEMNKLRTKLKEVEVKATSDEQRVKDLTANVRSLEDKLRAKEATQEQRVRDNERKMRERITKDQEDLQHHIDELSKENKAREDKLHLTVRQLESKLHAVTETLEALAKEKEKVDEELRLALEKITTIKKQRVTGMSDQQIHERETLIRDLIETVTSGEVPDVQKLREELEALTDLLYYRECIIGEKEAEIKRLKENWDSGDSSAVSKEELEELRETLTKLASHNQMLEQELSKQVQAAAKRDRVMGEQEKVLLIRDQLIALLQGSNAHASSAAAAMSSSPKDVAMQQKILDLQTTVERQAVRIKALESQLAASERHQDGVQSLRTRYERRIAELEHALSDQRNAFRWSWNPLPAMPQPVRNA